MGMRIKAKIERARHIVSTVGDSLTIERIEGLIRDYEQQLLTIDCEDRRNPPHGYSSQPCWPCCAGCDVARLPPSGGAASI
jgi:hypothetical protein